MKICYLADANSTHTKKWCEFFKSKGYDIHVISLNAGKIDGITIHSLNISLDNVRSHGYMRKLRYIKYGSKVKALLEEIKPDILHAHYATSYAFLGSITKFHPYIISVWGSDVYDFPKKNFVCRKFLERNLSSADVILSTSKDMAKETKKYTDKSIQITPFGVDINVFRPSNDRYKDREKIIIGTIKTLDTIYGIEYLIKSFSNLCKKYNNIELQIAGRGPLQKQLQKLCETLHVEDKVKFLGYINQEKVIEAFNNFDIAVVPSLFESFGVSAVEAQACGTPTIVSNAGGLPEATCPGKSSIVVEKENINELEEAMEKLIIDKDLRVSMGKFGRQFVIDNYNVEDNFNKVDDIYKSLLNK